MINGLYRCESCVWDSGILGVMINPGFIGATPLHVSTQTMVLYITKVLLYLTC